VVQGLIDKADKVFTKSCGKSCPLLKEDEDGLKLNLPKSNLGAAFKVGWG
jgi:hypothetical protein